MSVIIGGSGSTGSSLLKNILNRHPALFAGTETSFFCKTLIYNDWNRAKTRILSRKLLGLKNYGYHLYNGTDLTNEDYGWTAREISLLAKSSPSLKDFANSYFGRPMRQKMADIWMEKTPANAYCFRLFLDHFEEGRVIHMVRNPYDTITSLWKRGFDLYYATGIYLLNTATALEGRPYGKRYYEVHYEHLVYDPEATIRSLCGQLNIPFYFDMIKGQNEDIPDSKLSGWRFDETEDIQKPKKGRFESLSEHDQSRVLEAVSMIYISRKGQSYYRTNIDSIADICDLLGYEYFPYGKTKTYAYLKRLKKKDRINRFTRGYPTAVYYPLTIKA